MVSADSTTGALERLADELGSGGYATILTCGRAPMLRVVNRQAPALAEDVHTGGGLVLRRGGWPNGPLR